MVRVLRAGRQPAVRGGHDGQPGRHRFGHLRASVEKIYEALYGVTGPDSVDPKKALMTVPPTRLPKISTAGG